MAYLLRKGSKDFFEYKDVEIINTTGLHDDAKKLHSLTRFNSIISYIEENLDWYK